MLGGVALGLPLARGSLGDQNVSAAAGTAVCGLLALAGGFQLANKLL